jgi:hypothetical protein
MVKHRRRDEGKKTKGKKQRERDRGERRPMIKLEKQKAVDRGDK